LVTKVAEDGNLKGSLNDFPFLNVGKFSSE